MLHAPGRVDKHHHNTLDFEIGKTVYLISWKSLTFFSIYLCLSRFILGKCVDSERCKENKTDIIFFNSYILPMNIASYIFIHFSGSFTYIRIVILHDSAGFNK